MYNPKVGDRVRLTRDVYDDMTGNLLCALGTTGVVAEDWEGDLEVVFDTTMPPEHEEAMMLLGTNRYGDAKDRRGHVELVPTIPVVKVIVPKGVVVEIEEA